MFLISATVANAQHPSNNNLNARKFEAGWWTPQTTGSTTQLMISMAGLTRFEASDPIRNSPAHPTNYRVAEPINGSISSLRHYESALFPTAAMPSLSEHPVSLPPTSFLSLLQNYTNWETSLSDSRSLTDVNGVSVYPLIQISYADWHLPVTLYISSLRNNNAW